MKREIFLEYGRELLRMAVVEDGKLCEYALERAGEGKRTGSLYKGRVQRVLSGMQAAFVDIGLEKNAFLPLSGSGSVRGGQELLVQVLKDPPGETKGLRLTREITLPGRLCVLKPGGAGVSVSRKLAAPAQERLRALGGAICPPDCGLLLRTQAERADDADIETEARALYERLLSIERAYASRSGPGLVLQEEDLAGRMLRDLLTPDTVRVAAQGEGAQALRELVPENLLELHDVQSTPIFDVYGLETKAERACQRRVWLDCGGYLVIDPCEAMTVIDVNSGKYTGKHGLEETAYAVNLEAAREIARQLRLRDVGGIVVADFIDMEKEEHVEGVLAALREALASDRSKTHLVGMTGLGLVELTRKRLSQPLGEVLTRACPLCRGAGRVLREEEVARRALLEVRRRLSAGSGAALLLTLHPSAAQALSALCAPEGARVYALAKPGTPLEKFALTALVENETPPQGAALLNTEGRNP